MKKNVVNETIILKMDIDRNYWTRLDADLNISQIYPYTMNCIIVLPIISWNILCFSSKFAKQNKFAVLEICEANLKEKHKKAS